MVYHSAIRPLQEGGILVRASALARVPPFATQAHQSQQAQQQCFPSHGSNHKVRRMLENESGTGIMCSLRICPSLDPQDFTEVRADNVLYDTGCETTTVYRPEQNIVYASDILTASEMFGIDGNITPVIRVKRYVSLMPIRLFEPDITYYVDINLPILTVGLLVSVFRAQSPEDQDSLAHKLIAKAYQVFGPEEAYNLLDTWHNQGFPEPTGRLLNLMGIKGSFHFPYKARLGYNLWQLWAREGIEYREEQGRLSIWGR
jgi:hypothetical protein